MTVQAVDTASYLIVPLSAQEFQRATTTRNQKAVLFHSALSMRYPELYIELCFIDMNTEANHSLFISYLTVRLVSVVEFTLNVFMP